MTVQYNQPWLKQLNHNPVIPLLNNSSKCLELKICSELFDQKVNFQSCWNSQEVIRIIKKQRPEGFWNYPQNRTKTNPANLDQYHTYRNLGMLVEMYKLDRSHPSVQKAAKYFFSVQTAQGDFRGIYNKQYTPNYTAGIAELLIKAGYTEDKRVIMALEWLLTFRQNDGGWALPFRTKNFNIDVTYNYQETIEPDFGQPSSYMITGVVLRAFSEHHNYNERQEIKDAGELVSRHIFNRDTYADRQDKKYWTQFVYPFCYSDLISVLDSLSKLGFSPTLPNIQRGLKWFVDKQLETGLWDLKITRGQDKEMIQKYLDVAICNIFKQFYE